MNTETIKSFFPEVNHSCAAFLYVIEVALRELIVEELSSAQGPTWYKSALPGGNDERSILHKYRESKKKQKEIPWMKSIPFHPIYCLDFPDLATIIEKRDNWQKAFQRIFKRKEILIADLRKLEPIRNDIAHNRKVDSSSLDIALAVLGLLINSLGEDRLSSLIGRCSNALNVPNRLYELRIEIFNIQDFVKNALPITACTVWKGTKHEWWFDSDYLETDLTVTHKLYEELLPQYKALPKGRGSGYKVERWVKASDFNSTVQQSLDLLDQLLSKEKQL